MSSALDMILDSLVGRPDGNVSAELRLMGKVYSISQFNVSFSQNIDQFGEPQSESYGGQMLVVIPQLPDRAILSWAAGSRILKNGEIVFKNETETTTLMILFENAYCTCLRQEVNGGSSCSFTISPQKISLNGETLDNDWE
ncbi:MAG: type VI secretion system needle protein Hcp [Paludibacteraceae bacterium]|nr:type VI secretion system needle protein Hcp [Paludibacteraceae bacterium]